ncbi:hypothetical protein BB559_001385, partial [Furculomyces boomerangus]
MAPKTQSSIANPTWSNSPPRLYLETSLRLLIKLQPQKESPLIEIIRKLAELVVLFDIRYPTLLNMVIELCIFDHLLIILKNPKTSTAIIIQIFQTLGIIIEGVTNSQIVYFLIETGYFNHVLSVPILINSDDELAAYYSTFLKSLSFKINQNTADYFISADCKTFPLFSAISSFFDSKDRMAQVALKSIILNMVKVKNQKIQTYITNVPNSESYFIFLMRQIREKHDDLVRTIADTKIIKSSKRALIIDIIEDHIEMLTFINDLLNLNDEVINQKLTEVFKERLIKYSYYHFITTGNTLTASK